MILPVPRERLDERSRQHLDRLKNGCILLSREELQDPNFTTAVVLICAYSDDGAYGLVVNRPSHMPLSEVFESELLNRSGRRKIYVGGPVRQEVLQVLQIVDEPLEEAYEVAPGVYLGGNWEDLDAVLDADQSKTRLFLGYSGWAPGQLESEIIAGAWDVYNLNVRKVMTGQDDLIKPDIKELQHHLDALRSDPS